MSQEVKPLQEPWLSPDSAARYLDVSVKTVQNLIARREIPFERRRRITRLRRQDLDAWLRGKVLRTEPQLAAAE